MGIAPRPALVAFLVATGVVVLAFAVTNAPDVETDDDDPPTTALVEEPAGDTAAPVEALDELSPWLALGLGAALVFVVWRAGKGDKAAEPLLLILFFVALSLLITDLAIFGEVGPAAAPETEAGEATDGDTRARRGPSLAWLAVVGVGIAGLVVLLRRRARSEPASDDGEAAAQAVAAGLADLESIADPRQAVITAYARMETTLAAAGIAREPAETSREFVGRVLLGDRLGHAAAIDQLGRLYERARFDQREVSEDDRAAAIVALRSLRSDTGAIPDSGAAPDGGRA